MDRGDVVQFQQVNSRRCVLAESPVWDVKRGCLFWVDIEGSELFAVEQDGSNFRVWKLDDRVCSIGLCDSGRLILAFTKNLVLFDPETSAYTVLVTIEADNRTRLNDGKVGPDGAFWVGSMDENPERAPVACLYRVTSDAKVEKKISGLRVSNGLAWSPDEKLMFHADTRGGWVDRWDFGVVDGTISNRVRIRSDITDSEGRPDGGTCDIEGCYWSAGVSGALLNRYDQDGALLLSIHVPVPFPTMPCFGGEYLDTIYLTSMTKKQSIESFVEFPFSGTLIASQCHIRGIPGYLFPDF